MREKPKGRKAVSFKSFARAPAASGKGACKGAQRLRKSRTPPRRAEREKARAAWLVMHIVCIPVGHFRCIHLFRTVGDSNPTLIIKHFRGENRACLRMFTKRKIRVRFLAGGYFCAGFFSSILSLRPSFSEMNFKSSIFCLLLIFE